MNVHILIADDHDADAQAVSLVLEQAELSPGEITIPPEDRKITVVKDGAEALRLIRTGEVDVLVSELVLPSLGGKELVRSVLSEYPDFPIIVHTRFGSFEDAFELARIGIHGYFRKSEKIPRDFIFQVFASASGQSGERPGSKSNLPFSHYKSRNGAMANVFSTAVERVARTNSTVLIAGESGTGKELLAKTIHHYSSRSSKPFIAVNCAALPENLIESELFGHEKGSFTGAGNRRIGRFEQADKGTFFLDEIGDLSLMVQTKLLRVIQERTIERVGGNEQIPVDVRIIAATHRNLKAMVQAREFREDLYYRLSVITLDLPALRERPEDVAGLANFFLKKFRSEVGREHLLLTPRATRALQQYPWPGNVRELENVIEGAVVMAPGSQIDLENLPPEIRTRSGEEQRCSTLREARAKFETEFIEAALKRTQGNVSAAAEQIGIARKNLQEKIKRYGIEITVFRSEPEPVEV